MKKLWLSLAIGLVGSVLLLLTGFCFQEHHGFFLWLNRIAFGASEWIFPYIRHASLVRQGRESPHLHFVLLFSLISWWCIFTAFGYFFVNRKRD
jgi:hypothetical protein